MATASRSASSTSVASGGGDGGGQQRLDVGDDEQRARARPGLRAGAHDRVVHALGRRAGLQRGGARARPARRSPRRPRRPALRARVSLPTPSGPTTSTPSRAEPPRRSSSSGRSKVSSSHSTRRCAAAVLPTRSSMATTGRRGLRRSRHRCRRPGRRAGRRGRAAARGRRAAPRTRPLRGPCGRSGPLASGRSRRVAGRGAALPPDHRARPHRHRPGGLDRGHREQLARPARPQRARDPLPGGDRVRARGRARCRGAAARRRPRR